MKYTDFINNWSNSGQTQQGEEKPRVSYFGLSNDKETAVVRFMDNTPDDFDVMLVHDVEIDGKRRKVKCLRESIKEPFSKCPLCAAGSKNSSKYYARLLQYVVGDDGKIVAMPKIWEKPSGFISELVAKFKLYGDLSDQVFVITRNGAKGDKATRYSIDVAPAQIYKPEIYVKDFSAFDTYSLHTYVVLNMDEQAMTNLVNGVAEEEPKQQPATTPEPQPQIGESAADFVYRTEQMPKFEAANAAPATETTENKKIRFF